MLNLGTENAFLVLARAAELERQGHKVINLGIGQPDFKTADHIVDMGPEGGINGGEIIAEGTPEKVAENDSSYTGKFLKPLLLNNRMKKTA